MAIGKRTSDHISLSVYIPAYPTHRISATAPFNRSGV
jgi:hypothetical protein